ncbi:MAG: GerAB/ArcD/ProY family transporter [Clostridia bacterium]|nr:GerAB/ArcD/ProY family transporter [Clostridia bacterium]
MNGEKLKLRQLCFALIVFTGVIKIIVLPSFVSGYAKENLWISALLNFLLDGVTIFFILKIADKFKGKSFFQILNENLGDAPTKTIMFLYAIYFLIKSYVPILEQKSFVEIALYETTHVVWIFAPIFLISCFFSYKGLKTVGRLADLLIWIAIFSVVVLLTLSIPACDFSNLLPIVAVPFKNVLQGSKFSLLWFFDSTYLLFFIGNYKPERLSKTKIMLSYLAVALVVTIFFCVLYSEFGALTERQYFAPIKMGKYYLSLSNTGRIDYFAGFALAIVCVFAVTLPLVFSSLCLSHTFNFKHKILPCIIVNGAMAIIFFATQNFFFNVFTFILNYVVYFLLFMAYVVPLITLFFKKGRTKK